MALDGLMKVAGSGLRVVLLPFVRWLRSEKKVELPADDKEIVDEWITIAMAQVDSTVDRIAELFKSDTDPEIEVAEAEEEVN